MKFAYAITPFAAWLVAGILKFVFNSIKARRFAFDLIGYGGLPSNHSAIVSSIVSAIAFNDGIAHPAFGVAVTLCFIVVLDASSLRRQVGQHAATINRLTSTPMSSQKLRERIGHTPIEICAGIITGVVVGAVISAILCSFENW